MEAGNQPTPPSHTAVQPHWDGSPPPCQSDPHHEDLVLVRRLLAREECAWKEFVERYQRLILHRIHATARELHMDPYESQKVEEICSDVFAALVSRDMNSLRQFSGRSRLSTWLAVVVRRTALRSLSGRQPRTLQPDTGEMDQIPVPRRIESEHSRIERDTLEAALTRLSDADRRILWLYYDARRSYADIGAEFGISENSVGPRLNRARRRLKTVLQTVAEDSS